MKGPELEKLLVGALLDSAEPLKLLQASGLQPETFSDKQLRICWDIAWQLAKQGKRVDSVTLFSAGRMAQRMEEDDLGLLQRLQATNALDEKGFVHVAMDLRRIAHARLLGEQLVELGQDLLKGSTPAKSRPRFLAISENYNALHAEGRRGSTAVVAAFESFERRKLDGRPALVPTGIKLFDEKTGGLPPKLIVFLGEPGIGKSALIATMLLEQLKAGLTVVLFSLEDGDEWLIRRHLALMLDLKVRDVFNAEFPDGERASVAGQELANAMERLWFVTKSQARTPEDVLRISTQYIAQQGANVIWLDNATALKHQGTGKWDAPNVMAGRMYDSFAGFADTYRIPMVVLAHTTRKYQDRTLGRGPPAISDVAETADADRAIRLGVGLWRKRGKFRLTVIKHTEGESGVTMEFDMHKDAALVDAGSGQEINLHAEAREERKKAADRNDEAAVARRAHREALRAKLKASVKAEEAPPAEEPPQLSLLELEEKP